MEDRLISAGFVRKGVATKIKEWCEANGHTYEVRYDNSQGGRILYCVNGSPLTPDEVGKFMDL